MYTKTSWWWTGSVVCCVILLFSPFGAKGMLGRLTIPEHPKYRFQRNVYLSISEQYEQDDALPVLSLQQKGNQYFIKDDTKRLTAGYIRQFDDIHKMIVPQEVEEIIVMYLDEKKGHLQVLNEATYEKLSILRRKDRWRYRVYRFSLPFLCSFSAASIISLFASIPISIVCQWPPSLIAVVFTSEFFSSCVCCYMTLKCAIELDYP